MDPNATLKDIRDVIRELRRHESNGDVEGYGSCGIELADHFQDLDEWLSKGGFLPDQWKVER